MNTTVETEYKVHRLVMEQMLQQSTFLIGEMAGRIVDSFRQGHKLLLCGNGGSAADAQHISAEFVNRFRFDHAALPAIALTTDTSILTAIGNDSDYDNVFSRQVEALARPGDILAGISTSGGSGNILKALDEARNLGVTTLGFTGEKGRTLMAPKCDYCLVVPSVDTPRIQECHLFVWHVLCGIVEESIFSK